MSTEEYVEPSLGVSISQRLMKYARPQREDVQVPDTQLPDANAPAEAPQVEAGRKRPRLDLSALARGGERKRGKSMFGVLLNTLNKAKAEDKERNASEAVCLCHLILSFNSCLIHICDRRKGDNSLIKGCRLS